MNDNNASSAKPKGWFSRRHESRDAHDAAVEQYKTRASRRPSQHWDDELKQWVKFEAPEQRLLRAIFGQVSA